MRSCCAPGRLKRAGAAGGHPLRMNWAPPVYPRQVHRAVAGRPKRTLLAAESEAQNALRSSARAKNDRTPSPIRPISHDLGEANALSSPYYLACVWACSSTSVLADVKLHERQAAQARAEDEAYQGYVQGSPPTVIGASDRAELPGKVGCTAGKGVLSDEEFANQKAMMLA